MEQIYEELKRALGELDIQYRILPVGRLSEVEAAVIDRLDAAPYPPLLAQGLKNLYRVSPEEILPDARSIIVMSVPERVREIVFHHAGQAQSVLIPPGYVNFTGRRAQLHKLLCDVLAPAGYQTELIIPPLKLLAVRSGLARYGRNNLCYVEGQGCCSHLSAFLTTLPPSDFTWAAPTYMPECERCVRCQCTCPTGALENSGVVVDRCLTRFNRMPGEYPEWIDKKWLNSLFGCLKCIGACPFNAPYLSDPEHMLTFCEADTATLLAAAAWEDVPAELAARFDCLGFPEFYPILLRNIRAILLQG